MARLLPLLLFFGFAIFMAVLRQPGRREPRDPRAYRPRTRTRSGFSAGKRHGKASHTLRRADLAGLREIGPARQALAAHRRDAPGQRERRHDKHADREDDREAHPA